MNIEDIEWGPVVIEGYWPETRIGYYDDDDDDFDEVDFPECTVDNCEGGFCEHLEENAEIPSEPVAIVFPGQPLLTMNLGYYRIPIEYIRPVTTDDLWRRREELWMLLFDPRLDDEEAALGVLKDKYERVCELAFVDGVLMDRMMKARLTQSTEGKKVFISHSSLDKQYATWLSVDLANAGHKPWLDAWDIKVGQSIPLRIAEGLDDCDVVVVILTNNTAASKWVETEWQSKYWDEVRTGAILVIPALFEKCEIPRLLSHKKYADFRDAYGHGLDDLLLVLR